MATRGKLLATYLGNDDPARKFTDYFPEWLKQLDDEVSLEGSLLKGVVHGREAVQSIVVAIRSLYDNQEWYYAGEIAHHAFVEDYVATVRGESLGCIVLAMSNDQGKVVHIAANYRPFNSLLLLSRLLCEKFAGTALADYFANGRE